MAVLSYLEIVLAANSATFNQSIRDARDNTKVAFSDMREAANKMGPAVGAAVGGAAVATAALVAEQITLANELQQTANVANSSIKEIQRYTVGAKKMGIEQDALGAIFQDTTDKIGDFLSTGGGGMADFFENIAPQIGVTAEEFRNLSGPQALQLYYDSLEQANIGQNEMTFYMEAIASDATTLIPLLAEGGAGFDTWAKAAENAGAVMDAETIRATKELQATTDLLELSVDGAKTQFVAGFIPVLADAAGELVGTAEAADTARLAGASLGEGLKSVSKVGIGVISVFNTMGTAIGGFAAGMAQLGNGVDWNSPFAFFQFGKNFADNNQAAANVFDQIPGDISDMLLKSAAQMDRIDALGTGSINPTIAATIELNERQDKLNRSLGVTGQQYQAQQDAAESAAKAAEKATASAIKTAEKQARLVGIAGNSGIGTGSHIDVRYASGDARRGSKPSQDHINRFEVNGKSLGSLRKTSDFNLNRVHPVTGKVRPHYGIDYDSEIGDNITTKVPVKDVKAWYDSNGGGYVTTVTFADGVKMNLLHQTAASKNIKGGSSGGSKNPYSQAQMQANQMLERESNRAALAAEREAAEQARLLEQQAKQRLAIRYEYADEVTRIETNLQNSIERINASGFDPAERDIFVADARRQADIKIEQLQLVHDRDMQYAQQAQQTDAKRIRAQYALERREIQLTINMDEQLRTAKIDALNQAEQLALDERRYAFESELRQLTSVGQSDLAALRQSYADQRRALDMRTDINGAQKSDLRNAMASAQIYDTNQLQKGARDGFNAQQADMNGTGANYAIAQQYQARLDIIQDAVKAEVLAVEQAEQAKYAARLEFETAATQLSLSQAEQTAGNFAASFKTMMGEQNAFYQIMFAAQQSFVMASAGLNMYEAWGDAMAEGATTAQKFAAAATIATEFGRIISAASSMTLELPGYRSGGYTGDAPEDQIVGYVHGREHVSDAATTKRYRPELEAMSNGTYERQSNAPNINVNVSVTMDGKSSVQSDSQYGRQIGQGLAAAVTTQVQKMMRPNGMLDRQYQRR